MAFIEIFKLVFNIIAYTTKLTQNISLRADGIRGVIKTDMEAMPYVADKYGTALVGSSADCYHIIPCVVEIFHHTMWPMSAYVNFHLFHYLDGKQIDLLRWFRACGEYFQFRVKRLEKTMRHLTAATVAGA